MVTVLPFLLPCILGQPLVWTRWVKVTILHLTTVSDPAEVGLGAHMGERSRPVYPALLGASIPLGGETAVQALQHMVVDDHPVDDHRPRHHPPFGYAAQMVHALLVSVHVVGLHRGEVVLWRVVSQLVSAASLAAQLLLLVAMPSQAGMSPYGGPDRFWRASSHLLTHHLT